MARVLNRVGRSLTGLKQGGCKVKEVGGTMDQYRDCNFKVRLSYGFGGSRTTLNSIHRVYVYQTNDSHWKEIITFLTSHRHSPIFVKYVSFQYCLSGDNATFGFGLAIAFSDKIFVVPAIFNLDM